jgi:predicted MFS family arabinose efflux permease
MLGFWFFITQFLQGVYHYTPLEAGVAFLPLSVGNFAVALIVPKLTRRWGNARVLAAGVAITFVGMAWLSRLSADTPYATGLALPMILLGIGQGASLGPLTAAGIAADDAGAASGLLNVAHQLGGSLGLGILVTVFAAADSPAFTGSELLAHQIYGADRRGRAARPGAHRGAGADRQTTPASRGSEQRAASSLATAA